MIQTDLLFLLTPVTFGGYSSELKKALDRKIPNISPYFTKIKGEMRHKARYKRHPSLLCLGLLPGPDPESERIFHNLVGRNALNFHPPVWAAGILYRDQTHKEMREGVKALVRRMEAVI